MKADKERKCFLKQKILKLATKVKLNDKNSFLIKHF